MCMCGRERERRRPSLIAGRGSGNWLEDELLMAFPVVFVVVRFAGHEHNKSNNNNHGAHEFSLCRASRVEEGCLEGKGTLECQAVHKGTR